MGKIINLCVLHIFLKDGAIDKDSSVQEPPQAVWQVRETRHKRPNIA